MAILSIEQRSYIEQRRLVLDMPRLIKNGLVSELDYWKAIQLLRIAEDALLCWGRLHVAWRFGGNAFVVISPECPFHLRASMIELLAVWTEDPIKYVDNCLLTTR